MDGVDTFVIIETVTVTLSVHENEILRFLNKWQQDGLFQTTECTLAALIRGTRHEAKVALAGLREKGCICKKIKKSGGGLKIIRLRDDRPFPPDHPFAAGIRFRRPFPPSDQLDAQPVQRCADRKPDRIKLRERVFKKTDGKCFYCDAPAETIDHKLPKSRGGGNYIGNLIGACRKCNEDKSSATTEEYLEILKNRHNSTP